MEDCIFSGLTEDVLTEEFGRASGVTYLDHAGATLYSGKQLRDHVADLSSNLYSNPHSRSPSSLKTTAIIDGIRETVLKHFNTTLDEYDIIFTSGCTAALSLLSYSFPWQSGNDCSTNDAACRDDCEAQVSPNSEGSSWFCYLDDNHTSVVGMREVAHARGANTCCMTREDLAYAVSQEAMTDSAMESTLACNHLFAFPAQSNFSGFKYPLSWCKDVQERGIAIKRTKHGHDQKYACGQWKVALDGASFVSSSPLDLSQYQPDFVAISFYKIFGFPTGLGALLVRRDNEHLLSKSYYGGGTVRATDSWTDFHASKQTLHDRLEDGTLPFLEILALRHGFAMLSRLARSMLGVQQHTFKLARLAYEQLSSLTHSNGNKVCVLYTHTSYEDPQSQGPIVNFNVQRPDGSLVGYSQVERLATVCDIHLRTGCFCNTGACMAFLGITSAQLQQNLKLGHECGDAVDLIDGRPTGSVRVSFGLSSTIADVSKLLEFMKLNFVEDVDDPRRNNNLMEGGALMETNGRHVDRAGIKVQSQPPSSSFPDSAHSATKATPIPAGTQSVLSCGMPVCPIVDDVSCDQASSLRLTSITVYPIKSCAGFKVQQWPVGAKGLLYDREWMVVGESGSVLFQKQVPHLCLVQPVIDLQKETLVLTCQGHANSCIVPLTDAGRYSEEPVRDESSGLVAVRVCGDRVQSVGCGEPVSDWLSNVIGRRCRLVRQSADNLRRAKRKKTHNNSTTAEGPLLSLVNEGQYLMVAQGSLELLLSQINDRDQLCQIRTIQELADRFRANLVVGGQEMPAYLEERWTSIVVEGVPFEVAGPCTRCQMVCVDPLTGRRGPEPLRSLVTQRGSSKATFGIYLSLKAIHEKCLAL